MVESNDEINKEEQQTSGSTLSTKNCGNFQILYEIFFCKLIKWIIYNELSQSKKYKLFYK